MSWGCGCLLLFKPQIPGAGRQSCRRRGRREGTQSPRPCSRGRHQQKATVFRVLPVHPATRPAAQGQPLGTPWLLRVPPTPLPVLESQESRGQALSPRSQPWSIPTSPRTCPCPLRPVYARKGARATVLSPSFHRICSCKARPSGAGGRERGRGCCRGGCVRGTHPAGPPEPCPAGAPGPAGCLQSTLVVQRTGAAVLPH